MQKKKITVPEVKKAYKQTGIEPEFGETLEPINNTACPLGVLYLSSHPQALTSFNKKRVTFRNRFLDELALEWASKEYGKDYVETFIDGVDGRSDFSFNRESKNGFKEGRDIKKALFSP